MDKQPVKHWLDYFDIFAKVVFSLAAAIATFLGVVWTREINHRNQELVERQTKNQIQGIELQDRASQAQAAWSVMPYLNCESMDWLQNSQSISQRSVL